MTELLESRSLMAATAPSIVLDGTVLRITGTSDSDTLYVTESYSSMGWQFDVARQLDGDCMPLASVPESMVSRVVMDGQSGNDFLALQTTNKIGGDVYGGYGSDEIHLDDSGSAVSTAHGGSNDDVLVIFNGNGSKAYGDDGDDRLTSLEKDHRTYLDGGTGVDRFSGTSMTVKDDDSLVKGLTNLLGL